MQKKHIMILGVGCILYTDEGFGIRVVERMMEEYDFPDNVSLVDGGVLGMNLLGVISEADFLIVVDAIRNNEAPGSLYRLEGDEIPERIRAKNSLHQVDFLEALTMCQALDKVPHTVIVGVEPEDIDTLSIEMTSGITEKVAPMIDMVLAELDRLNISWQKRSLDSVSSDTLKNHSD